MKIKLLKFCGVWAVILAAVYAMSLVPAPVLDLLSKVSLPLILITSVSYLIWVWL